MYLCSYVQVHEQSIIVLISLHIIYEFHSPTGRLSMVEQLVKAGANVNSVNEDGYSILEAAISGCMNLPHISISIITLFC